MKTLPACAALLALAGPVGGCQRHEPTRPAQPTVRQESGTDSGCAQARSAGPVGFAESLRRRHMDLP